MPDAPISPARPRDVLVLVGEAQTKAWLAWIKDGEAAKVGLAEMAARSLAREPGTRHPRGHGAKIEVAVAALRREGQLPSKLRPGERNRRVLMKLEAIGYGGDLPSRPALDRFFSTLSDETGNSVESVKAENGEAE
jgi:hypothetical protein